MYQERQNKTALSDVRWNNYCNNLISRIKNNSEDFPNEDDLNKLVRYTEKTFDDSPFLQHAMDKAFAIRRLWDSANKKRLRQQRMEDQPMEEKLNLTDEGKEAVLHILTKLAQDNGIESADNVLIKLNAQDGTIVFKNSTDDLEG